MVFSCKTSQPYSRNENSALKDAFTYPLKEKLVSIHRGGGFNEGYPENCVESFIYYHKQMPTALIECDVRLSADSVLFLLHDDSLQRTTDFWGKAADFTMSYLGKSKLKDHMGHSTDFSIPTLEAALTNLPSDQIFTLDVKRGTPYSLVMNKVNELGKRDQCIIITYSATEAFTVYSHDSRFKISATIKSLADYQRLKDFGLEDKNLVAFIGTGEPDKSLIDFLHQKGILCILGTIGNLDKMAEKRNNLPYLDWSKAGVDIFATDRPLQAYRILNE